MTLLSRIAEIFDPLPPDTPKFDTSMAGLVNDFRETRASAMAELIESSSTRGAQLSTCQSQLQEWQQYARSLEQVCLAHGLEVPKGPGE